MDKNLTPQALPDYGYQAQHRAVVIASDLREEDPSGRLSYEIINALNNYLRDNAQRFIETSEEFYHHRGGVSLYFKAQEDADDNIPDTITIQLISDVTPVDGLAQKIKALSPKFEILNIQ